MSEELAPAAVFLLPADDHTLLSRTLDAPMLLAMRGAEADEEVGWKKVKPCIGEGRLAKNAVAICHRIMVRRCIAPGGA